MLFPLRFFLTRYYQISITITAIEADFNLVLSLSFRVNPYPTPSCPSPRRGRTGANTCGDLDILLRCLARASTF